MPEQTPTPLSFGDLEDAYLFVSMAEGVDASAFVHRRTGQVFIHAPDMDVDEIPEDELDDAAVYAVVPDESDLEMGTNVVRDFVALKVPELGEQITAIFRHRGAYAQFKNLLDHSGKLDLWHDYEAERLEAELREWCEREGFELGPRVPGR